MVLKVSAVSIVLVFLTVNAVADVQVKNSPDSVLLRVESNNNLLFTLGKTPSESGRLSFAEGLKEILPAPEELKPISLFSSFSGNRSVDNSA